MSGSEPAECRLCPRGGPSEDEEDGLAACLYDGGMLGIEGGGAMVYENSGRESTGSAHNNRLPQPARRLWSLAFMSVSSFGLI